MGQYSILCQCVTCMYILYVHNICLRSFQNAQVVVVGGIPQNRNLNVEFGTYVLEQACFSNGLKNKALEPACFQMVWKICAGAGMFFKWFENNALEQACFPNGF